MINTEEAQSRRRTPSPDTSQPPGSQEPHSLRQQPARDPGNMRLPGSIFVAARRARRAVDFPRCRSTWSRKPSAPFCVLRTASVSQLWPRRSLSGRGFFFFSARRRRFRRPPIDLILRPLHQLRQLRHVDRDPAGFVRVTAPVVRWPSAFSEIAIRHRQPFVSGSRRDRR